MNLTLERLKIAGDKRVVYIAGPYRNTTEEGKKENIWHAIRIACRLAELGWYPLCPHANTANFDVYTDLPDDFWIDMGLEMLKRCDAVFMLRGWQSSVGSLKEHELAEKLNIPIYYEDSR